MVEMDSFKVGGSSGSGSGIRQRSPGGTLLGGANKRSDVAYHSAQASLLRSAVCGDAIIHSSSSSSSFSSSIPCWSSALLYAGGGVGLAWFMMTVVCPHIPYAVTPEAARLTYQWTGYRYDPAETHFDNTIWTYGTDYFLCLVMAYAAMRCFTVPQKRSLHTGNNLPIWSGLMLSCYATSVLAGGLAHQFYSIQDETMNDDNAQEESRFSSSLNSLEFRILWTICVGTVTLAGGMMGACGSAMARQFQSLQQQQQQDQHDPPVPMWRRIPVIPESLWVCYGVYLTFLCARGDMSFTRPACDIFIAGTTQFPPTAYVVGLVLLLRTTKKKSTTTMTPTTPTTTDQNQKTTTTARLNKIGFSVGFFLNAPLLPMYPILVQYSGFSLGTINTILHTNLLCAWSLQAHSLYQMSLYLFHNSNDNSSSNYLLHNDTNTNNNSNVHKKKNDKVIHEKQTR